MQRERQYTGGVPAEQKGEAATDEAADALNPFADPEFLAALEDLRTTPEERAARRKEAGNAAMKDGGKVRSSCARGEVAPLATWQGSRVRRPAERTCRDLQ